MTLTRLPVVSLSIREQLWNAVLQRVCERRGHQWRMLGRAIDRKGLYNLPFGRHDYCVRCERHRVVLKMDGFSAEVSKSDYWARDPEWAAVLYEARWGEGPKQKLWRGEWPEHTEAVAESWT